MKTGEKNKIIDFEQRTEVSGRISSSADLKGRCSEQSLPKIIRIYPNMIQFVLVSVETPEEYEKRQRESLR